MALTKEKKQKTLEELKQKIARQKSMVLIGITGLKVKDLTELRNRLKIAEGSLKVIKKSLAELAFKEFNLDFRKKNFKEEVALVFGFKDEITSAKTVYQFSQINEKLKILGGFLENQFKTSEEMIALAKLPGREELLAKLFGSMHAPISNFARVMGGNIKGLVYILSKIKTYG